MREFLRESILDNFKDGHVVVTRADFARTPVTGVTLVRNSELDLVFELTSHGWRKEMPVRYPAGTVRAADEVIEFSHAAGWVGVARGVIPGHVSTNSERTGEAETIETFSAHSVELNFQRAIKPSYIIEWISNVSDGFVWTEPVRFDVVKTSTKSVGSGSAEIRMTGSSKKFGGNQALHLTVSGIDLYVMRSIDQEREGQNAGQIIYRDCPDQAFRDKVRTCLSFILGKPIVYLGHTEYCDNWIPTFIKSVDAFSINGSAFRLHDLPSYPINDPTYANVIDQKRVTNLINVLLEKFDDIRFNELSWSYWYAVCAPVHAAAIHFGSLIEKLQNNSNRILKTTYGKLLDDQNWNSLKSNISQWLESMPIDSDIRIILEGKISSLNQAPPSLILKRLLDTMGLRVSDVKMKAWKHRNMAAHGGTSDDPIELILNSKILKLLFHRMLAGITCCSDSYIDYYNIDHPVRPLNEAIPGR